MARPIGIGKQDFEKIRLNHNFYIDKTNFIRKWWDYSDEVTLITRPRRFGKTLNMSMVEKFFSVDLIYGRPNPPKEVMSTESFREPIRFFSLVLQESRNAFMQMPGRTFVVSWRNSITSTIICWRVIC